MQTSTPQHRVLIGIALLGWLALVVQLYLMILNRTASLPETLVRFFSFFTILTNILVAGTCSVLAWGQRSPRYAFFARGTTLTAVAVYIAVVGLIYNGVLRQLWQPQGMQRLVDELLHLIIPVLFVIYWLAWAPKRELRWNSFWAWLIYPLVYVIYALLRGSFSGFYPYPFIDIASLGFMRVMFNSLGVTLVFLIFSLLLTGIAKIMSRKKS